MAPLPSTLQTLPTTVENILTNIHKRSSDCTYYDTSCGTHRTVVLIIIVVVGATVAVILSLVYARGRKRRIARERAARVARQHKRMSDPFNGVVYEAPPPYMPRAPENVARVGR
ncbi:Nn.00g035110.m01.CDS01 [Neocucurbitaria sp. VM-36]